MNRQTSQETIESRRNAPRRTSDNCVTLIDGKAYPVENWSKGGLMIQADDRLFSLNAPIHVTLKFRLTDKMIDIPHTGKIIRKMRDKIAIQFEPANNDILNKFKKVIDDCVTREFANSQMI